MATPPIVNLTCANFSTYCKRVRQPPHYLPVAEITKWHKLTRFVIGRTRSVFHSLQRESMSHVTNFAIRTRSACAASACTCTAQRTLNGKEGGRARGRHGSSHELSLERNCEPNARNSSSSSYANPKRCRFSFLDPGPDHDRKHLPLKCSSAANVSPRRHRTNNAPHRTRCRSLCTCRIR